MSSSFNRGMGSGRGHTHSYQIAKPPTNHQTLQVIADEMAKPDLHSIYVAAGEPITIERYSNPDDMMAGTAALQPKEILRQVDPLIDVEAGDTAHTTYLSMMVKLQQVRMAPAALLVGSLDQFMKWLDLSDDLRIHMHPLNDRSCDFLFLGLRGYIDDSLPKERLVILGGETSNPTLTSVRIGLATVMEVKSVVADAERTERDSRAEEGR